MSNGLWTGGASAEKVQQNDFIRHRLLIVCAGSSIAAPWPVEAASGFANLNPNSIGPGTTNPNSNRGIEGGPHFIMSGETPDESHSYGFEFGLFSIAQSSFATAAGGGYTVTVWVLVTNTQDPYGAVTPTWLALAPQTGINLDELWHSFDINAEAVRFQFGNLAADPTVNNNTIGIAFSEL